MKQYIISSSPHSSLFVLSLSLSFSSYFLLYANTYLFCTLYKIYSRYILLWICIMCIHRYIWCNTIFTVVIYDKRLKIKIRNNLLDCYCASSIHYCPETYWKKRIKCKHASWPFPPFCLSLSLYISFLYVFFFYVYFLLLGREFSDLMVIKSVLFLNTNWFITRFDSNAFYFLVTFRWLSV